VRVDGIGWMSMSWMGQGVAVCRSLGACHPMKTHLFATYVPSFAVRVLTALLREQVGRLCLVV